MKNTMSCTYRFGARSVLPPDWEGDNLSVPASKLYYVEKGELVVEIFGETIVATPGDLLLIPANTLHSFYLTESHYAEKSWCHFDLKRGTADFFENYTVPPCLHVDDPTLVGELFRRLLTSNKLPPEQQELVSTSAICGLVEYYLRHTSVVEREIADDRIHAVITFIEQRYADPLTLEQLAKFANYSPNHLGKRFKDTTGYPPMRYLNNVRIERAKLLLQGTTEPISVIMERTGFTDAAYFSKSFKKVIGYSPQKFRKLHRSSHSK
ncbi:MAG: helix-turn-helix domain-containing protein [Clostridia bacterium]|nr:helix-turn-helix domain-containing protein [Clostridia bacterium]